jgi:hypothetical protein
MRKNKKTINALADFKTLAPNELVSRVKVGQNYKNKINIDLKEAAKGLRYYRDDLNFDLRKPLTTYQKRKVRNALIEYVEYIKRPNTTIVNGGKNRKALQELAQQPGKHWKKFFIPKTANDQGISFKGGKAVIENKYYSEYVLLWNMKALVKDPEKEINRIMKGIKFDVLFLLAGKHLIFDMSFKSVKALIIEVKRKMMAYGNFGEWMRGVKIVNLKNQASSKDYKMMRYRNKKENKKKNRGK